MDLSREKLKEGKKRIRYMRNLKDNWNGRGAPKIPLSVCDKAIWLIDKLFEPPTEVYATPNQSIQFQYYNGLDLESYLFIEIFIDKIKIISAKKKDIVYAINHSALMEECNRYVYGFFKSFKNV